MTAKMNQPFFFCKQSTRYSSYNSYNFELSNEIRSGCCGCTEAISGISAGQSFCGLNSTLRENFFLIRRLSPRRKELLNEIILKISTPQPKSLGAKPLGAISAQNVLIWVIHWIWMLN
jgi:hypothetical protein